MSATCMHESSGGLQTDAHYLTRYLIILSVGNMNKLLHKGGAR